MRIGGEAPRGGPILNRGAKAIVQRRVAAASGRCLQVEHRRDARLQQLRCGYAAGRSGRPSGVSPVVASRHSTIRSRGPARRSSSCARPAARPPFLMRQMTPGEFDHPAAHAGVACFREASLASSLAALVWSSSQAGVARQSPAVPDLAREHLLDEHVRGLDPDPTTWISARAAAWRRSSGALARRGRIREIGAAAAPDLDALARFQARMRKPSCFISCSPIRLADRRRTPARMGG
jgi:hypothetical protein